ncbi:RNB domain-containing ribonuclease [Streptomyces tremellae]|uniref:DRBM domain-containing protein n=1 Tax=Streptomyces tremellae TaxID=1124239 RepID=A0ABP7DZ19_9ACTN
MPAHASPAQPPSADSPGVPLMIDRKGSLDRDDAITVRRLPDGWELTVYVADVACGVAPGSTADQEAFARRESAYGGFRGTAKMLPRAVEARLTLAEGRACAALRVRVTFDDDGTALGVDVDRAQMRGALALDHHAVATTVGDPSHPLHRQLRDAAELSEVLLARRRSQGALALYDLLQGWATDEDGRLVRVAVAERNIAYKIVQECMIAANTALAGWAAERDLLLLFRNHSAAKVAPPREALLDDLDLALSEGSAARLQALQERTLLVLRAAEYAPFVRGHWGLNLPGYVHSTSPLRRYADLVVQRVVFSHIDGAPSPYTDEELQSIAESLNEGARADREAQQASLKSSAHARARKAASAGGDYSHLDSRDFQALLKRGCKENIGSASLAQEAVRRARQQQLTSLDLQMILLVASSDTWAPARAECLKAVAASPETAVSVLATHAQVNGVANPSFTDHSAGQIHNAVFRSRAELALGGTPVCGEERTASVKKSARHQAALSLLARLACLPDPSQDQVRGGDSTTAKAKKAIEPAAAEGRQPVMVLNEYTQLLIISDLRFDFTMDGPSHEPTFKCTARAVHEGDVLVGTGTTSTKSSAKATAAADLLDQIHARLNRRESDAA